MTGDWVNNTTIDLLLLLFFLSCPNFRTNKMLGHGTEIDEKRYINYSQTNEVYTWFPTLSQSPFSRLFQKLCVKSILIFQKPSLKSILFFQKPRIGEVIIDKKKL